MVLANSPSLTADLNRVGGLLGLVLDLEVSACMHAKATRLTTLANAATKVYRNWFMPTRVPLAPTCKPSRFASWQTIFDYELNILADMWPTANNIDVFASRARRLAKIARVMVQGVPLEIRGQPEEVQLRAGCTVWFDFVHDEGVKTDIAVRAMGKKLTALNYTYLRGKTRILYTLPESSDQYVLQVCAQTHIGRFRSMPCTQNLLVHLA